MSWNFTHPHFETIYQGGAEIADAELVVIGFHGKGGNGAGLFNRLDTAIEGTDDVAILSAQAADGEWFSDQYVSAGNSQLQTSLAAVAALIQSLNEAGIPNEKIVLVGHSQGALLINEYVSNTGDDFKSIASWSGALVGPILEEVLHGDINPFNPDLSGLVYDHIPPEYRGADLTGQTIQLYVHEDDPKVPLDVVLATADYYPRKGPTSKCTWRKAERTTSPPTMSSNSTTWSPTIAWRAPTPRSTPPMAASSPRSPRRAAPIRTRAASS